MSDDLHYPWVEEYRPKKIEDVIGAGDIVVKMKEFIDQKSLPNLLLIGNAGTGKTTIAKILAKEISGEDGYLYINASDERGMDTIRTKVQDFCSMASFADLKVVILDEADGLTIDAQKVLRAVTEQYSKTCRFILTANYETKLIEPVRSRLQSFVFKGASKNEIANRCLYILKDKNISLGENFKQNIISLIQNYYPDIRSVINNLQKGCVNGEFRLVDANKSQKELYDKFISFLKEKSVRKIREEILSNVTEYDSLYNVLYENVKSVTENPSKISQIIILLANYQYQNMTHINKELNFVACLLEIVQVL